MTHLAAHNDPPLRVGAAADLGDASVDVVGLPTAAAMHAHILDHPNATAAAVEVRPVRSLVLCLADAGGGSSLRRSGRTASWRTTCCTT
jgi:hypothetical protein